MLAANIAAIVPVDFVTEKLEAEKMCVEYAKNIAAISNFGLLLSYLVSSFALIHFRRNNKIGLFRTPLYPYSVIAGIILLGLFIAGMPREALDIGVLLILGLLMDSSHQQKLF